MVKAAVQPSAAATPGRASASPSSPATVSLPVALTAADIVDSGYFSQTSDGLLGGLTSTDARVFTSADSTVTVEVDLVTDTNAAGAASDYPPYRGAAATQVATPSSVLPGDLGQQSNEYVGTNTAGNSVVAISFVEGRYIAVVTSVGSNTARPDSVKTCAESIAQAQDNKINAMGG